jgi:hypothetical protein
MESKAYLVQGLPMTNVLPNDAEPKTSIPKNVDDLGTVVEQIDVELGAKFLEQFSEQLYSSPNKAFEELVANSWDAGARTVYVHVPEKVYAPEATVYVLDDGLSMDAAGLHELWQVANSSKRDKPGPYGRKVIGKFGIGKLATYVLANKLTYICKAQDGTIRLVTMDYEEHMKGTAGAPKLMKDVKLNLRQASWDDVKGFLKTIPDGENITTLIENGIPAPKRTEEWEREYGESLSTEIQPTGTWTLVVLENLKTEGREIKRGVVRRMMQTSLPLGAELNIVFNGSILASSKLDIPVLKEWIIGKDFAPESISVPPEPGDETDGSSEIKLQVVKDGVVLPDIGKVTGTIKLYTEKISGGKSDELEASNGFFVNVLGRVTNNDPAFGEKDLSHSAWARFRMTVRADGLDQHLAVNREQFRSSSALRLFKAFLRKGFNLARITYDDAVNAAWPETGKVIIDAWGTLPLQPLRGLIEQTLNAPDDVGGLVDKSGLEDMTNALADWKQETQDDLRNIIKSVEFEPRDPDGGIARYRVSDRRIIVNSSHPFIQEHFATQEEKRTVRNFALLDVLSDAQAIEIGIDPVQLEELRRDRDRLARLIAQIDRRSGVGVARILIEVATYKDYKAFEILVGDALEYLGYAVERMGASGEPEGLARAFPTPTAGGKSQSYSFSYDAKSSKSGKVKTSNVNIAGLKRHRKAHTAQFALVIAPDFEKGALETECEQEQITPIRARDLGKLLQIAAEYGAIPLTRLKELFKFYTPDSVSVWVNDLAESVKASATLTLDLFIASIKAVDKDIPDVLSSGLVADKCRSISGNKQLTEFQVLGVARGLQILIPDLIRVEGKQLYISAHPEKLAENINLQLQRMKSAPASEFLSTQK